MKSNNIETLCQEINKICLGHYPHLLDKEDIITLDNYGYLGPMYVRMDFLQTNDLEELLSDIKNEEEGVYNILKFGKEQRFKFEKSVDKSMLKDVIRELYPTDTYRSEKKTSDQ